MPRFWIVTGVVTFVGLALLNASAVIGSSQATDLYFSFAIALANGFPVTPLWYAGGLYLLLFACSRLAKVASSVIEEFDGSDFTVLIAPLGFLTFVVLVVGTLSGAAYLVKVKYGCSLASSACGRLSSTSVHMSFLELVGVTVGTLVSIFYFIAWIVFLPALVAFLVAGTPVWMAAYAALTTGHPATRAVERAAAHKRPDRAVARELAEIMRAQEFDDARAARLFQELSPTYQWLWRARYAARTKEAARLRQVLQAQTRAMQEETGLAHDALDHERTKRRRL